MFITTETTIHEFSLADLKKNTTNFFRSHSGYPGITKPKHYTKCMRLIADLIKEHREEVLGSNVPYKIITNGYGEFLRVENELYGISASRIFKELEQYEK